MSSILRRLACNVSSNLRQAGEASTSCSRSLLLSSSGSTGTGPSLHQPPSSSRPCFSSLSQHAFVLPPPCSSFPSAPSSLPLLTGCSASCSYQQQHYSLQGLSQPWSTCQQLRGVFGAAFKQKQPQIHTHDKYKIQTTQPTYE
jgi:hypothetical protein